MKHWYIKADGYETDCEFISVNLRLGYLYLRYKGIKVCIICPDGAYNVAKSGEYVSAKAVTKSQEKTIEIIFK